jgi:outer membrane protein
MAHAHRHIHSRAARCRSWRWLSLATALVLGAGSASAQTRIGYIDQKRLLDNAPQMSAGSERLRSEFAERDRQLKIDETRLAELQDRQRNATTLDEALGDEIEALARKVRRTRETLRDELGRRSQEETAERFREINEAVAAFARENRYDLIVSSPVFYASPDIDITDQVLARLRQLVRQDTSDDDSND